MRRVLIAVVAVMALTLGAALPAAGQPEELGFEISPTEGSPGDLVFGQVDVDDVAEHCVTDPEAFQQTFQELNDILVEPLPGGANAAEFAKRFWDDPEAAVPADNHDQLAYFMYTLMTVGLSTGSADVEGTLQQMFVMTFADIATQEPVGESGNFDPDTGQGSVVVPDVDPGLWAVAAACVGLILDDLDALEAGIREGGAFLQEIGMPVGLDTLLDPEMVAFMQEFLDSEAMFLDLITEFVTAIAPEILPNILEPDAQGVQTFCVDCEPPFSQNLLDQFCGVLPEIQTVPDQLAALFDGVDLEDPATYPSVEEVEAFVNEVAALVELGDTSVPPQVAPQWSIATAELRELIFGLTAVDFDFGLLVDLSPEEAERIVEAARGEGPPDPEFDAALEVLTQFFLDNCLGEDDLFEDLVPTAPAAPVSVTPRFTG